VGQAPGGPIGGRPKTGVYSREIAEQTPEFFYFYNLFYLGTTITCPWKDVQCGSFGEKLTSQAML
jgi:hypothetical protein